MQRLESLLQDQQVPYETLTCEPAHGSGHAGGKRSAARRGTRAEPSSVAPAPAASKTRISARDMTQIVIVALDGRLTMVVLPVTETLDLDQLKAATGAREVRITSGDDHMVAFPDCEAGAIPPFGNLYDMPVYVAESLREDQQIIFAAGTSHRLMRLAYRDFVRLVEPTVAPLSQDAA